MSLLLHIETSSEVCSVTLSEGDRIISTKKSDEKNVHSSELSLYIKEIFELSGKSFNSLDAVAVSKGPGSFTGLRIGVSMAKGLVYGLDIPLISVNTMKMLAFQFFRENEKNFLYCPLIDAHNGEFYYAFYDYQLNVVSDVEAGIPDEEFFRNVSAGKKIIFGGQFNVSRIEWLNRLSPSEEPLKSEVPENWLCRRDAIFDSVFMVKLASEKFEKKQFEDLSAFEPFYLKDFKARKGSVKLNRILGLGV